MIRRQLITAFIVTVVLTVGLGVVYPLVVWGVSQVAFNYQANGSMVHVNGKAVGSALIGQQFTDRNGDPLRQFFQPRPSDSGGGAYNPNSSSASNLGPLSPSLLAQCLKVPETNAGGAAVVGANGQPVLVCNPNTVPQRVLAYRVFNGLPAGTPVPVDAVTASGSGLDPDISVANADDQAARVAGARHLPVSQVEALINAHVRNRPWGFLGENTVNVLDLNLALDQLP